MRAAAILLATALIQEPSAAPALGDFVSAGARHGVDPCLLLAVSLKESGRVRRDGTVLPSELAIRAGSRSYFPRSRAEALRILREVRERVPERDIDAGMMQLNLYWQKGRVRDSSLFLSPRSALDAAAAVLSETAASTDDPELQAGRYHSFTESLARPYGREVLRMRDGIAMLPGYRGICRGKSLRLREKAWEQTGDGQHRTLRKTGRERGTQIRSFLNLNESGGAQRGAHGESAGCGADGRMRTYTMKSAPGCAAGIAAAGNMQRDTSERGE
ncbi:MAG: hypothetical protein SPL25_03830 [Succinivibrionaceae bacterium]|nr:hypothetical protein [Succinivibrionaceae bacterium]